MTSWTFVCVLLCLSCYTWALDRWDLYTYGEQQGDTRMDIGDDVSSNPIRLQHPVTFYGRQYQNIYVNSNGHLSLETEIPTFQSDLVLPIGQKVIAPFLADIDTSLSGNIFYRETRDPSLLDLASNLISQEFPHRGRFQAVSLFLATWDDVGYYREQYDQTNTFQVVLASDYSETYALFLYPTGGINWVKGQGKQAPSIEDIPAQVGFDNGYGGMHYIVPGSGTNDIYNLERWSNTRTENPGLLLFRIGQLDQNVETPDQPQHQGGSEPYSPQSCHEGGANVCSQTASCEDGYRGGFCCVCNDGFYGNGINCLNSSDQAQRVSGTVSGTVNGIRLDQVNLHVYVMTVEGKAYIAIDQVPIELGPSLKAVYPIGGVMGWLFAVTTTPGAMNGYMITGGVFNRTVVISFDSGEQLNLQETFTSQDGVDHMKATIVLNGNIPNVPSGSDVIGDDTTEEYNRVRKGQLYSSNTHSYSVNGVSNRMSVEQTINYHECSGSLYDSMETMKLTRNKLMLIYGDMIVRYVVTDSISEGDAVETDNPCVEGSRMCDLNARCVVIGVGYQCECFAGYRGDGQRCVDVDECTLGYSACHEHASCTNTEGSYHCACVEGYRGDGQTCEQVDCNEVNNCDINADCVYNDYNRRYQCECIDGFNGDGFSCTDSGNGQANCVDCDPNASCQYDAGRGIHMCMCNHGYTGDGYRCHPMAETCDVAYNCDYNAQCLYDEWSQGYMCQCNPGYSGDGYRCDSAQPIEDCSQYNLCDINAQCNYDEYLGRYNCVCNPGYTGDGESCSAIHSEEPCNIDRSICDYNAECIFDVGQYGYVCACNTGYTGDGFTCLPDGQHPTPDSNPQCNIYNNCHPDAECIYDHYLQRYNCVCRQDYSGDGFNCERDRPADCRYDPSSCDVNAQCADSGSGGVFTCICNQGYYGDGFTCTGVIQEQASYLMYAQGLSVMKIPFNPTDEDTGEQIIYDEGQTAVGVGVDCDTGFVYWTDVTRRVINKARLDGTDQEVVLRGLGSPEGIVIDWIGRNMYWTDSESDSLDVANLDGLNHKVLFDDIKNARGIAIDPVAGLLFWTDWTRSDPKIETSQMDGSERRTLVSEDLGLPNGLTIDYEYQQLCWADAGTQRIECVNYDGRGRRLVYDLASYPFGLAYANRIFYWTDWTMDSLPSITRYGGSPNDPMELPAGGNGNLFGITTVSEQCPAGSNACALNNGGCQYLCLPTPNRGRVCVCPDDITEEECNQVLE